MEQSNRAPASRVAEKREIPREAFPELLSEFKTPATETAGVPEAQGEALREADKAKIAHAKENLRNFAQSPVASPTPYETEMNKRRGVSGKTYDIKATERNKRRTWLEKILGRGKVTPEDMAREDAEAAYVKISDLKRDPSFFANGRQGPEYNTMAAAMRRGATESKLAEVAAQTDPAHRPTWESGFAASDAENVRIEKDLRREGGLPTDVLNRDIDFQEAQDWERKQRERT